jgi:hypothetical protein
MEAIIHEQYKNNSTINEGKSREGGEDLNES